MRNNKKFHFILALFVAIALWGYVFGQSDSTIKTTIKEVPITILNEDFLESEGLAVSNIDTSSVNITFSGKRSVTSKLTKNDFLVSCDVYGLTEGTKILNLGVACPDDVTISNMSIQSVKVTVEQEETLEKTIFVNIINDNSDATEPYIVQLSHDVCEVTGGKSKVNSVEKVVCELDAKKVTNEMQAFNVELVPIDKDGNPISELRLSIMNVSITARLADKKTVPFKMEIVGTENVKFIRTVSVPSAITLKGDQDLLDSITEVNGGVLDVSMIYESCNLPLNIDLPNGVMLASNSSNISAEVYVDKAKQKSFTFSETDILANGIMPDVTVTINEVEVEVKVFGPTNVIDNLKKEDIILSVDASDLYWGTYPLKINVSCSKNVDGISLDKEEIDVYVE